jgi:NAD(P)-dependent dehydrogenase (short-subunit alcohol dehydrogenase family)
MSLKPINQQVVVIFGASSGIGRETALEFAKQGAKVVVAARNIEGLATLLADIQDLGGTAIAVPAEASDFEQVKAVADKAVKEFGRLDTWVHAAAVNLYATFEQTKPEEFKRVMDINAMGQVYGAMAALPHLKREGSRAIATCSLRALRFFGRFCHIIPCILSRSCCPGITLASRLMFIIRMMHAFFGLNVLIGLNVLF